jgi:hypothetical protein
MNGLSVSEIKVINQYGILNPKGQKQLESYLDYLTFQQCRDEFSSKLLSNNWFYNHLLGLYHLPETSDNYCEEVLERVGRLRGIYQGVFEQLFEKYSPILNNYSGFDGVLDWIIIGLNNISAAAKVGNSKRTHAEIVDLLETRKALTKGNSNTRVRAM